MWSRIADCSNQGTTDLAERLKPKDEGFLYGGKGCAADQQEHVRESLGQESAVGTECQPRAAAVQFARRGYKFKEVPSEGVQDGAGQPAPDVVAVEEAPHRVTGDAELLGLAPLAMAPCVDFQELPDQRDQLWVRYRCLSQKTPSKGLR